MYSVILADDEPLILSGLRFKIDWTELNFQIVAECSDGQEVLDAIAKQPPDLLVMDIQMPRVNGIDVMRKIHHEMPIPVIVISGYSDFAYAQEALRYGAVDYLLKPVGPQALRQAVLKARQQIDMNTRAGHRDSSSFFRFLRDNFSKYDRNALLQSLSLSGNRKYYILAAFRGGVRTLSLDPGTEVCVLRCDEDTLLLILHTDALPEDYDAYLRRHFSFGDSAGVAMPLEEPGALISAAEQARLALETSWMRPGIYLWPTENAGQSVKHYLGQMRDAIEAQDALTVSRLLHSLPDYVASHRLNVQHVETIYNVLANWCRKETLPTLVSWEALFQKYKSMDGMILALHDALIPEDGGAASTGKDIIYNVKIILQRDYAQPLYLQNMARQFHMDKSYLSNLFHDETGMTFTQYLTKIRVEHACEYLRTTGLSHSKIAQLCGFSSDSYMKKVFRKVLGVTPSAYRAGRRGGVKPSLNPHEQGDLP